jgi:hypothetical protein
MAGAAIYTLAGPDALHWGAAVLIALGLAISQRARALGCHWTPRSA